MAKLQNIQVEMEVMLQKMTKDIRKARSHYGWPENYVEQKVAEKVNIYLCHNTKFFNNCY